MAKRKKNKLNDAYRVERMQSGGLKGLASKTADKALPLILPRVNLPDSYIEDSAVRFARQLLGEHVRGKSGTTNLAGRSAKEVERLKNLDYTLEPWGTVAPETIYTPKAGEVRVGIPGDQTVANQTLVSLEGAPINSRQEGGSRYGLGQMHQKNPDEWEAWKSGKTQAEALQAKIDRLANLYGTDQVVGSHFAMGPVANNYAMHFADANLKAIDWSKVDFKKLKDFDKLIAYGDPVKGMYPDWPGLTNHELAMEVMRGNPNARKWFNSRMKVPEITKDVGLPNALDVQWAITEPRLRNMEVNTTGLMNYDMRPFRAVDQKGFSHGTYDSTIYGKAKGAQDVLGPFDIMFPDAAQHISSTQRPADFTGTIQKIYPHQVVDDQYINQYMKFMERVKGLTKKEGGAVELKDGGQPEVDHMQAGGLKSLASGLAHAIPQADRAANLAKYMEGAAIPERLYHATTATQGGKGNEALRNLKPSKEGALGSGIYMTPDTNYANTYAQGEGGNFLPLFTNIRNPLKITGEHRDPMKEALIKLGVDPDKADTMVERAYETNGYIGKQVQSRAQAQGFDGIAQYRDGDLSEVVAFNPNSVKSAIGNTGEYMPYSGLLGKAEGGSVEHMQAGGIKNLVGAGTKVLPKLERDLNLAKFLEESAIKERLYHATGKDFPSFDAAKSSPESKLGEGIYMTPDTKYANFFANIRSKQGDNAQIMPVYTSVKNPYVIEGTQNIPLSGIDKNKLQSLGHDGILFRDDAGEIKEVVAFEPTQIKSAIGNRGTYDTSVPDINKADGGQVEHMQMGGLKGMIGAGAKLLPKAERDLNLAKFLEDSALKQRLYHGSNQMRLSDEGQRIYAPNEGFSELLPSGTGVLKSEFDKHPPAVFLSPSPDFASRFAGLQVNEATPAVYPVHAKIKNPFDYANQAHMDALEREYIKTHIDSRLPTEGENLFDFKKANAALANDLRRTLENAKSHDANWNTLEDMKIQEIIRKLGHDAFYVTENGVKNIGVYDPKMIKSATGNQGTYDITTTELNKAHGGQVEHMQSGGLKGMVGAGMKVLPEVENAIANIKEANRISIVPMPNRWFMQPDKFPQMQGLVEKVLQRSGLPRESFTSGAYANPVTGEILDRRIFEDVGVAINPATNRPMMSAGKEAGIEDLEKELGALTRSNLVRKGLFKREGGDSLLDDLAFLATIERSGMGHKYGLSTEYGSPTLMFNTGRGENPTLRPTSRGDVFGMGDVVGRIKLGSGQHHDVYEKLFVAPKGMDVPGVKLHEASGGAVHMADGGNPSLFSDKERELIFGEGVNNPLFSIYGNTPMPPANSPVIEATPQSPTQKAIGTLGGYLDKAGRFITEAIEPIAQSNPIKTAIADMFIAEQLKNAGTALQDWTKTGRDYDERPYTSGPFYGGNTLQTFKFDPRTIDLLGVGQAGAYGATRLASAGAKAAAPYATKIDDVVREIYESNKIPQVGLSIKDVTPKALAPANEMGFYSPAEAAALNLQRKSGSGQAFLNDLLKQENVRPDEINAMGLDTFLKGKKDVTAAEVQDYIANNKIQLGETVYGKKQSVYDFAIKQGMTEDEAAGVAIKAEQGDPRSIEVMQAYKNITKPKFSSYALPGGENYREVVITMPTKVDQRGFFIDRDGDKFYLRNHDGKTLGEYGSRYEAQEAMQKNTSQDYKSSHWDEPNALAHLRMSDRVTDGKKTLLVDEVQSDWHQAARDQRTAEIKRLITEGMSKEDAQKAVPDSFGYKTESTVAQKAYRDYAGDLEKRYVAKIREEAPSIYLPSDAADLENFVRKTVNQKSLKDMAKALGEEDKYNGLYYDYNLEIGQNRQGVPDAPFKDDWYQLALKRAVKEAIDGGYDRVALPTGARVAERFDLSKQIDRIDYNKNSDGTYSMSAIKDGREVFAKEGLDEKELSGIVGKDVAKKIVGDEGSSAPKADRWEAEDGDVPEFKSLSGLDLQVGGEGMRKYYDEIYPGYLKKFGKKYGANVGMTQLQTEPSTDRIFKDVGKYYAYTGQGRDTKEFNTYAEALKFLGIGSEPLHYMEITPAMREAFKTGIHMKDGGAVNMQTGGMPKTPVGGELKHTSFQELRHDMGMAEGGDIMHRLVKHAADGGEIDDLQHALAKKYLETLNA
jgi:hypothetical protein